MHTTHLICGVFFVFFGSQGGGRGFLSLHQTKVQFQILNSHTFLPSLTWLKKTKTLQRQNGQHSVQPHQSFIAVVNTRRLRTKGANACRSRISARRFQVWAHSAWVEFGVGKETILEMKCLWGERDGGGLVVCICDNLDISMNILLLISISMSISSSFVI